MKAENIISELKKGKYKPVYWLEGEEEFFIDNIIHFAEHSLLPESEASFNLTVFYGRDADWTQVINACRRYPMFSEKQVVIIKEAQAMRELDKLEKYIENPQPSTLLFVACKGKKLDGRTRLAKMVKDKAVLFSAKKLYEKDLPEWAGNLVKAKGLTIQPKALHLLIDHIGNDLSRINNEIDKISINLSSNKSITEDDIEKFVGISKEFNVYELQDALAKKDLYKAIRIALYFDNNPKAAPIQLILPSLYNFYSKLLVLQATPSIDRGIANTIGVPEWKLKEFIQAAGKYSVQSVEKNLLLLHQYNLRSLGVDNAGSGDGTLLKEMIVKMLQE